MSLGDTCIRVFAVIIIVSALAHVNIKRQGDDRLP